MKTIDTLTPEKANEILAFCKSQKLKTEYYNGQRTQRRQKWFGLETELYSFEQKILEAEPIEGCLAELRDRYYPEANSILLYCYEIGTGISPHSDRPCFYRKVVLINLVDEYPDLFGDLPKSKIIFGGENHYLQHGEVVKFDSRIVHSVPAVRSRRFSLQLRKVKY